MTHHRRNEERHKVAHPVAVAALGALSLLVFGAAGWSLGRMRAAARAPALVGASGAMREPKAIARGRLVYQVHCARCHGSAGHGDGADAAMLKTLPRDLASVVQDRSDDTLRRSIIQGIAGTPMAGFGQVVSARELDSLVAFVRSLAPVSSLGDSSSRMPAQLAEKLRRAGFVPEARRLPAPRLDVRGAMGATVSLGDLHGSLVLLVFWGTSCSSCVEELPGLQELAGRYGPAGLTVLPVCLDQTNAAQATAIAAAHAKSLPVYVDADGFARLRYDVHGLPTAVLIDRNGRVLGMAQGAKNWLGPEVHALLTSCLGSR